MQVNCKNSEKLGQNALISKKIIHKTVFSGGSKDAITKFWLDSIQRKMLSVVLVKHLHQSSLKLWQQSSVQFQEELPKLSINEERIKLLHKVEYILKEQGYLWSKLLWLLLEVIHVVSFVNKTPESPHQPCLKLKLQAYRMRNRLSHLHNGEICNYLFKFDPHKCKGVKQRPIFKQIFPPFFSPYSTKSIRSYQIYC